MTQHLTDPGLHRLHTGKQRQQRTFAATARAMNEQMFALSHSQFFDLEQRRLAGPGVG
jgi:hypothetical protein